MNTPAGLLRKLEIVFRLLFHKEEVERELDEELRYHVDMEARELEEGGMTPAAARREAHRRFGGLERTKERVRGERGGRLVEELVQDVRYAGRVLRKSRGFTVAILVTLALGVGANTSIFTVVEGVLLRPLPFPEPDRLVTLSRPGEREADVSLPDAGDLRRDVRSLASVALYMDYWSLDLTGGGQPPVHLSGDLVDPAYFSVFRAPPLVGRYFGPEEDREGAEPQVVLSEGLWRRRFGGDPSVVGTTITLNDRSFRVVAVAPARLQVFPTEVDAWVPAAVEAPSLLNDRGTNNFEVVGRLAPGATMDQARSELRTVTSRLAEAYPRTNASKILQPTSLRDFLVAGVRPALWLILGAVGLVLLIACVNLANLLLARATRRRAEISLRQALGGTRGRIGRQLLVESGLLALGGGVLGVGLALTGVPLLLSLAPSTLPRAGGVSLDARVLLFAVGLVVLTTVLCGIGPVLYSAGRDPASSLRAGTLRGGGDRSRHRLLDGFVVAEVSLAVLLLIGAGLLARSYRNLRTVDLGFVPKDRTAVQLVLPESRYADLDAQTRAFRGVVGAVRDLPGVVDAGFAIGAPFSGGAIGHSVLFDDRPPVPPAEQPGARNRPVLGDYFRALGVEIVRGRGITDDDRADDPPVAVVNERFARRFWPDGDALGKRIAWRPPEGAEPRWMTIVGVAADVRTSSLTGGDEAAVYTPYVQRTEVWQRFGTLIVHSTGTPPKRQRIQEAVSSVDPDLPVADVEPLPQLVAGASAGERFSTLLLLAFGAAALLIAVQGIYGVLSYGVASRKREMGIRMALGASAHSVVGLVLRRALLLTSVGLLLGMGAALPLTRLIRSLLYGVAATDTGTYLGAAGCLLLTALLAAWTPARRASRSPAASVLNAE